MAEDLHIILVKENKKTPLTKIILIAIGIVTVAYFYVSNHYTTGSLEGGPIALAKALLNGEQIPKRPY